MECELFRDLAYEFIQKVLKVQVEFCPMPRIREFGLFGAAMGACCLFCERRPMKQAKE